MNSLKKFPDKFIVDLKAIINPRDFVTDEEKIKPSLTDWVGYADGKSSLMLTPRNTEEVSGILKLCSNYKIPIVPQGGNTGSVAGAIPNGEIILNMTKMNSIREINPNDYTVTVDAGCILEKIHELAIESNRFFPLSIGSQGTCTIGGNISTNAGGISVLKYGNMRDLVLGLEVVLPNGEIWNGLRRLRKDNTGYALKHIFMGAEGTLGIITAACLRLFPEITEKATAFASLRNLDSCVDLLELLRTEGGDSLSSYELIPDIGLDIAITYGEEIIEPLSKRYQWNVIIEFSGTKNDGAAKLNLENTLNTAIENGIILDAIIANSLKQANSIWKIRKAIVEYQPRLGGEIKHDVAVPISNVPEFIKEANDAVRRVIPDIRPVAYGHIGDGNIHYNVCPPLEYDHVNFKEKTEEIHKAVYDIAFKFGGSFAAEHGVGVVKKNEMLRYKSETEINLMKLIKISIDPNQIMNPGKVLENKKY
jgi:FAD/FMN-containing dehydrogenase